MDTKKDKSILKLLQIKYNNNVTYTKGLFHIIDMDHNEIYINRETGEKDNRCKYRTLVVLDNIIIARVIGVKKTSFVILDKLTLKVLYKTSGIIKYIDKYISYSLNEDNTCDLINYKGKIMCNLDNIQEISAVYNNIYLIESNRMFSDKLFLYNSNQDKYIEITGNKQYTIKLDIVDNNIVHITDMLGMNYTYDCKNNTCYNEFTEQYERIIYLWS